MTDNMVWFEKGDSRFLLCARGVAINWEWVLLFNVVGWHWWALPGYRVTRVSLVTKYVCADIIWLSYVTIST